MISALTRNVSISYILPFFYLIMESYLEDLELELPHTALTLPKDKNLSPLNNAIASKIAYFFLRIRRTNIRSNNMVFSY